MPIGDRAESHKEMPSSRWDHCEEHLHEWSLAMWLPRISVSCLRVNQVGCGSLIVLHLGRSTLSRWSSSKIPSNKQRVSLHLRDRLSSCSILSMWFGFSSSSSRRPSFCFPRHPQMTATVKLDPRKWADDKARLFGHSDGITAVLQLHLFTTDV